MPGLGPVFLEACMCGIASSSSPQPEDCGIRKSFAYQKLPQQLLRLSVLKLDGSCFEIQVPKGASIAELKEAVVKAFGQTQEEEQTKISWYGVVCRLCGFIFACVIKDGSSLMTRCIFEIFGSRTGIRSS
ncbi:hypothetical protein VitviT2T_016704 [Vitis vinifera]|uniref:SNRNP25 ubiquitin-like domain-containing protein n=1 Tax=Vitis vinifera TaxID=29760 RepID=A0ABY9CTV2_VITVI|nr:hypothetical protein VitviT2T_016704 [Vitis vinifera]